MRALASSPCAVLLALAASSLLAQPPADLWSGFDGESYELIEDAAGVSARRARRRGARAASPRRLVYYLPNNRRELVTITVNFRAPETGGLWDRYDRLLRDGLEPLPAEDPSP